MPDFHVTVDLVVLTIRDGDGPHRAARVASRLARPLAGRLAALLVRRGIDPYAGQLALPGGYVLPHEELADAAYRELREETGLGGAVHLEQLASYGAPGRDPRGPTVTVAFLALAPMLGSVVGGSDAAAAEWTPVDEIPWQGLAFDHAQILCDGIERARAKLEYSSLGAAFCPPEFTIGQLRAVYEAVWGYPLDPRNFHRKVSSAEGFLEPVGRTSTVDGGRPAQLFRRGQVQALHPPLTRGSDTLSGSPAG